ncbi:hypothetical protein Pta02_62240 [Planobispora takensis]|uniref:Anti-sigma factor antagonist n=1 Tax=Planobispora takensis TaxID=1367882 RepID=A0A8J3T4D8_9ACTN|nr:hypothetical protein Pta02_62240 [Planobispora takensis]
MEVCRPRERFLMPGRRYRWPNDILAARFLGEASEIPNTDAGEPVDLKLEHRFEGGLTIVEVAGEVDVYTAPKLRELLIGLVGEGHFHLLLNMEKVDFLDSTALGVLVGGLKRVRAHDGSLELVCTQERILKIFKITGLSKVFGIYTSTAEALAAHRLSAEKQGERPLDVPIRIYLTDEEGHRTIEEGVEGLAASFRIDVFDRLPPVTGSWFRELRGRFHKSDAVPTVDEALAKITRAIEMQALLKPQAEVDAAQGDAVAKMITALEKTSKAVIQIGSVMLVKFDDSIVVRNLTQLELAHWEQNPVLFRDPAAALEELQRATANDQVCRCGSGLARQLCHPGRVDPDDRSLTGPQGDAQRDAPE